MPPTPSRRIPHARRDRIRSADDAMAVFAIQRSSPLTPETLVMVVDASGCGVSLITVSDTPEPHQVVHVAESLAEALGGEADVSGFVIASVRPRGGLLPDDDTLWFEADDALDEQGLVLYDWLVIGPRGARSVRDELGVPSRWSGCT